MRARGRTPPLGRQAKALDVALGRQRARLIVYLSHSDTGREEAEAKVAWLLVGPQIEEVIPIKAKDSKRFVRQKSRRSVAAQEPRLSPATASYLTPWLHTDNAPESSRREGGLFMPQRWIPLPTKRRASPWTVPASAGASPSMTPTAHQSIASRNVATPKPVGAPALHLRLAPESLCAVATARRSRGSPFVMVGRSWPSPLWSRQRRGRRCRAQTESPSPASKLTESDT